MAEKYSTPTQSVLRSLYWYDPVAGEMISRRTNKATGWIEDGYVSYVVQGDCVSSGTVAVSSSNSYEIYILPDPKPKGEFLKSELIKKKWTITFND
jgi:hypothetical protein